MSVDSSRADTTTTTGTTRSSGEDGSTSSSRGSSQRGRRRRSLHSMLSDSLLGRRKATEKKAAAFESPVKDNGVFLHGTLDPEGDVKDLFYDAVEFGDGDHGDEFEVVYRRESVVLNNILTREVSSDVLSSLALNNNSNTTNTNNTNNGHDCTDDSNYIIAPPERPPAELPLRFLRAGKGDAKEGMRRYNATLAWRKEHEMDTILREPNANFETMKRHYPHFMHLRGKCGEPCYYEQPPRTDLKALKRQGVTLDLLLRHYAQVTEFQWQYLERDDLARSICVFDLAGIRFLDFAGEVIDFVKRASEFTGQHYPERAGYVFVINVPAWFKVIWSVVKPMVDDVTLEKIYILRGKEVATMMQERIPLENIPPEYGGTSMALGESPEEVLMGELIEHNNALASRGGVNGCTVSKGSPPCKFCSWKPARSY